MNIKDKILQFKQDNHAVILAHYYVSSEVQDVADYVGDSFYLSKVATETDADIILFCGVEFMGESAKLLNPSKMVLMPDVTADCPMAHMCDRKKIEQIKAEYPDVAVVCYINSTAELKSLSDVCVTSANAQKVVSNLPNKNIFFIPDGNLGRYIADKLPDKHFILNEGYCPIHNDIKKEDLIKAKNLHPDSPVLSHPECTSDILAMSDFIGSTSEIIQFASTDSHSSYIVATETGVFYNLKNHTPDKEFYPVTQNQICPGMKLISLEKIAYALEHKTGQVILDEEFRNSANKPLQKMLELSR